MTHDELIALARQVSNTPLDATSTPDLFGANQIVAFAKLVAAKEREACAKVCDSEKKWWDGMSHAEKDIYQAIENISACIRARGE